MRSRPREVGDLKFQGNNLCNLGLLYQMEGASDRARGQYDAALALARDIGNLHLQSVVLCNLGTLHDSRGDFSAARARYEEALAVVQDLGDRATEGQVLGYLGLLHARERRSAKARAFLRRGEELLEQVADANSLAILLCASAEAEHLAGDTSRAEALLARARAHARSLNVGEASELGLALGRVSTLIGR